MSNLDSLINSIKSSPNNGPIPSVNLSSKRIFGGRKKMRGGGTNIPLNNIPLSGNVSSETAATMQKLAQANLTQLVQSQTDKFSGGRIIRKCKRRKSKRRKSKRTKSKRSIYSIL